MIVFRCAKCEFEIHTDDRMAGGKGKCPRCKGIVQVPETSNSAPSASPTSETGKPATPHVVLGEHRCPRCTAKVTPDALLCGYCKEPLSRKEKPEGAVPITLRAVVSPQSSRGKVMVGGLALAAIAAAGIYYVSTLRPPEIEEASSQKACELNMEVLYRLVSERIENDEPLPKQTGKAFWVHLVGEGAEKKFVRCEEAVRRGLGKGAVYRGPKEVFGELRDTAPIACDPPGLHEGGMGVLYKNGTVKWLKEGSYEYKSVLRDTSE